MGRRFECPFSEYPDAWIELPDVWLGRHAQRRDQAVEAARRYNSETMTAFAAAMALLENWRLPGLEGNPEHWDFSALDLRLIAWVSQVVLGDFAKAWEIPKNS